MWLGRVRATAEDRATDGAEDGGVELGGTGRPTGARRWRERVAHILCRSATLPNYYTTPLPHCPTTPLLFYFSTLSLYYFSTTGIDWAALDAKRLPSPLQVSRRKETTLPSHVSHLPVSQPRLPSPLQALFV